MEQTSVKTYQFNVDGTIHRCTLVSLPDHDLITLGDKQLEVRATLISDHCLSLDMDGRAVTVYLAEEGNRRFVSIGGRQYLLEEVRESSSAGALAQTQSVRADYALVSPMPGQVVKIQVSEGDLVKKNQTLAIVEAMKMENELRASARARVKKIYAAAGDLVDAGQVVVELEPEE